jgi:putative ABC transport system permease protein
MNLVYLSYRYVLHKPLQSILHILLFALGIGLMLLVFQFSEQVLGQARRNVQGTDLVVGAKGSPLQLILCNIFHVDFPTGNIPLQEADRLAKHPQIEDVLPLALGDSYQGYRLVGTTMHALEWYGAKIEQGSIFKNVNEVVLGAKVAEKLGMTLKDGFHSSHGFSSENADSHEHFHFKVSGILSKTHTVADELIFCEIPAIWKVHDEHNESLTDTVEYVKYDLLPGIRVPAASDREITSLLIKYRSPRGALQIPRYVNANTNMQSASPAFELARIQNILGTSSKAIQYLAIAIVVIAILSIAFNMYNAMQQRQYDLAVMYSIGAGFRSLYAVLVIEGMILALSGFVTGLLFTHLAIAYLAGEVEALSMLNTWKFIDMEFYTAIFSLFVGALSAFIPTLKIRRQNTATILASG